MHASVTDQTRAPMITPLQAAQALWVAFLISWYAASLWTSKATVRTSGASRLLYFVLWGSGFTLLFAPVTPALPLLRLPSAAGWLLVAAEAGAFAFTWWARVHLGRLWSGMITLREGHRVVDTGPYRLARHPIYTGFIGAAWALALIAGTPFALSGALILTAVMTWKAGQEETFLRRELGAGAYDAYAARTPMVVPFAIRRC